MLSEQQFKSDMARKFNVNAATFSMTSRPVRHVTVPRPPSLGHTTNHAMFYKVRSEEKLAHPVRVQSRIAQRPFRRTGYKAPASERPVQPPPMPHIRTKFK